MTRDRINAWIPLRTAVTVVFLGYGAAAIVELMGVPRITDTLPFIPEWLLWVGGGVHLWLGILMIYSGLRWRRFRLTASAGDDLQSCRPFKYVKRPVYGGMMLLMFGSGLLLNQVSLLMTAGFWYLFARFYVHREDRGLARRMDKAYALYNRSTPMLYPHMGRVLADLIRVRGD